MGDFDLHKEVCIMKNTFRRSISFFLAILMVFCLPVTSFASDEAGTDDTISPRGIWGGEGTCEVWGHGTFNVYLPKGILRAGMTLKTECSDPNSGGGILFLVYDPNGRLVTDDEILGPNDEDNTLKIWNAPAGTYKVEYSNHGTSAPVRMYCWIYG